MYVQAELRGLISEISPMSKESARKLKLIYATYEEQDNMVVSKEYFDNNIATSTHKKSGIDKN